MFEVGSVVTINCDGYTPSPGKGLLGYKLHPHYNGIEVTILQEVTEIWSPARLFLCTFQEEDDQTSILLVHEQEMLNGRV